MDGLNDRLRRIVGVLRGTPSGLVLVLAEQRSQFFEFCSPFRVAMVERLRNAAPSDIADEYSLLFACRGPVFNAQPSQKTERRDIVPVLGFLPALAQSVCVGDDVVRRRLNYDRRRRDRFRRCPL